MKRLLFIGFTVLLLAGCSATDFTFNFDQVEAELAKLDVEGEKIFEDANSLSKDDLQKKYGIDTSSMEEVLVRTAKDMEKSSMYMMIKPVSGKKDDVRKEMDDFFEKYQQQWAMYYPKQEDLVADRMDVTYGNYLVYIVSENNEHVLKTIKMLPKE